MNADGMKEGTRATEPQRAAQRREYIEGKLTHQALRQKDLERGSARMNMQRRRPAMVVLAGAGALPMAMRDLRLNLGAAKRAKGER